MVSRLAPTYVSMFGGRIDLCTGLELDDDKRRSFGGRIRRWLMAARRVDRRFGRWMRNNAVVVDLRQVVSLNS